jgi:hypothetical protein
MNPATVRSDRKRKPNQKGGGGEGVVDEPVGTGTQVGAVDPLESTRATRDVTREVVAAFRVFLFFILSRKLIDLIEIFIILIPFYSI